MVEANGTDVPGFQSGDEAKPRSSLSAVDDGLQTWQQLVGSTPSRQGFARCAFLQLTSIADVEMQGRINRLHFRPGDGRGDRSARSGPRAVGHDRRRPSLVAQIVDKDPSLTL